MFIRCYGAHYHKFNWEFAFSICDDSVDENLTKRKRKTIACDWFLIQLNRFRRKKKNKKCREMLNQNSTPKETTKNILYFWQWIKRLFFIWFLPLSFSSIFLFCVLSICFSFLCSKRKSHLVLTRFSICNSNNVYGQNIQHVRNEFISDYFTKIKMLI